MPEPCQSPVTLKYDLGLIECIACGEKIHLSRHTLRDQFRVAEELSMAQQVHADCAEGPITQMRQRKQWRIGMIRDTFGRRPDRLAYRA